MVVNAASAAMPNRPRSLVLQTPASVSAGGVTNEPPRIRCTVPAFPSTATLPSGMLLTATGAGTDATAASVKPNGGASTGNGAAPTGRAGSTTVLEVSVGAIARTNADAATTPTKRPRRCNPGRAMPPGAVGSGCGAGQPAPAGFGAGHTVPAEFSSLAR